MTFLLAWLVVLPVADPAKGTEIARWSFERGEPGLMQSDEVPGKFIYDPLAKRSQGNSASAAFSGEKNSEPLAMAADWKQELAGGNSVTLEAFVKPDPEARGNAWLFGKSRRTDDAAELAGQWVELRQFNQTWHGVSVALPGAKESRFPVGHYSSSTRLARDNRDWRHVAVAYDADAKRVTCWVDYHLTRALPLERPLTWDDGPLLIGGRRSDGGVAGKIDEVRVTRGVLGPAEFLRARDNDIRDVSFRSDQTIVPRDAGCLDVKEHFGAAGDGRTDDTAAFNSAFRHLASRVPLAYSTLIIPPGEYLVSGRLHCSRFIDVKGAGPDRTTIRLKDGTFTDPADPQPVLRMSSSSGSPGSNRAVNGSSISIYLDGLTIDTGRNPGAKALEYHSNNFGRLENVVLRDGLLASGDCGVVGLDLTHHDVGPALVKRVRIDGFRVGVAMRYQEYSMTFEHLTLRGQREVGFRNQGNIAAIRGLVSENSVPAIVSEGANSMVTLLDSRLIGQDVARASSPSLQQQFARAGSPSHEPAIRSEGGLYCLRVETAGYRHAIAKRELVSQKPVEWRDRTIAGPRLEEFIGDQLVARHGSPTGALRLPIVDTPEPPVPPVTEWTNVLRFADRKAGDDWGPAVQAAIDAGSRVVYFPHTEHYSFATPVRLHGRIERLVGFGGQLGWDARTWKGDGRREQTDLSAAPPPLLIFDDPSPDRVVVLDRLGCVHVRHASPGTLVLRSSSPDRYSTGETTSPGRLFAEDIGGADWHFDHPQHVWVRQWNPESHAAGPCIHSRGATIWSLGFKTEYESQKLLAEAGAQTELLGAFIYPLGKIPPDRPIFENRDSRLALIYGTSVYQSNHRLHIRDTKGTEEKLLGNDSLRWSGSRARMDLYASDAR